MSDRFAYPEERLASLETDAARWRAVAPTLRVRNVALGVGLTEHDPLSLNWRRTWLESANPLNGTAYTVEAYADALRTGQLSITEHPT